MTTLLTLLMYMVVGALLAWPCWFALRHALHARRPLRCVQPYLPQLPAARHTEMSTPPSDD